MTKPISSYLSLIYLILASIGLFLLPLLVIPFLTDAFILPKQAVVVFVTLVGLLIWGVKMVLEKKVTIRITPLLLPVSIFFVVILISALIPLFQSGGNFKMPLVAAFPLLTIMLFYLVAINLIDKDREAEVLMWALMAGTVLSAVFTILNFFQIYLLPFPQIKNPAFNTFGNLFQQLLFVVALLPVAIMGTTSSLVKKDFKLVGFAASSLALVAASILIAYQLFTTQKPLLLPQTYGLQTATGAIGQKFQTLLVGSGPGTYVTDFTRFRNADFNSLDIWNIRFFNSSSLMLEILATLGLLGLLSFAFIAFRFVKDGPKSPLFLSALILFILSVIFPFTYSLLALFFIILALFAIEAKQTSEITLHVLALGKTVSANVLPVIVFVIIVAVSGFGLYYSTVFVVSNYQFQQSLIAASQNKGTETYNLQVAAIRLFPYHDGQLRAFSQTNLALANALVADRGQNASDQDKQTVVTLVQQAIQNGRGAVTLYPTNVLNWENLASVYRALIGFGQNADNFAIGSAQQAVRLDPVNPQLYLFLGGIYYQLNQLDQAKDQFQIAVNLKPDFANAHYNLGHALESKNDLKGALIQYQAVQTILSNLDPKQAGNEDNKKRIDEEINVLTARLGEQEATTGAKVGELPSAQQPPLSISTPSATLPAQKPPVEIPQPPTSGTESAR